MKIELTEAEALVLSDWLYRNRKDEKYFNDDAVKRIFWSIECQLERELVEPFYANYNEIIAEAKKNIIENK